MLFVFTVGNQTLRIFAANAAEAIRRAQQVFPGQNISGIREAGQSGDANFRLISPTSVDAQGTPTFTPETQVGTFLGETVSPENVTLAEQFQDRITVADPRAVSNLNEVQRREGLFRNFALSQGLNPTGIGATAVNQQFVPAQAAQVVGQQLAGQGFQSGLAPGAVGTNFTDFLNASGGFGNINQTAGNVFGALLSQSDPNLQNQQFLNPDVLGPGGSFTNDANFILQLARASARNRIGGIAAQFGLPSNEQLQTQFQAAPQQNFAQFAASALGIR